MSELKYDCFAFSESLGRPKCTAIEQGANGQPLCSLEECPFYKSRDRLEKELKRQKERAPRANETVMYLKYSKKITPSQRQRILMNSPDINLMRLECLSDKNGKMELIDKYSGARIDIYDMYAGE